VRETLELLRWRRQHTDLCQNASDVADRPILDDLAVSDAVDGYAFGFDVVVSCRDAEELSGMDALAKDEADDEVSLRDL